MEHNSTNWFGGIHQAGYSEWSYFPSTQFNYMDFGGSGQAAQPVEDHSLAPVREPAECMYQVKFINPKRKSEFMVRIWHAVSQVFKTPAQLREKLRESFPNDVSTQVDFKIGYMEANNKRWIVESEDLALMYRTLNLGTRITLWCDGRSAQDEEGGTAPKKRKTDTCSESSAVENAETVFKELKEKHPKVPNSKLRLWAKMIDKGRHDDYDNPPNIPLITGSPSTSTKKTTMADALVTLATAIKSPLTPQKAACSHMEAGKFSPMSGAKLRKSCLDDLKTLKELFQDDVITESEFGEQKEKILHTLKKNN